MTENYLEWLVQVEELTRERDRAIAKEEKSRRAYQELQDAHNSLVRHHLEHHENED